MGVLALVILYPAGNLKAVDAYFFGASASTESGLNTSVVTVFLTSIRTVPLTVLSGLKS